MNATACLSDQRHVSPAAFVNIVISRVYNRGGEYPTTLCSVLQPFTGFMTSVMISQTCGLTVYLASRAGIATYFVGYKT